MNTGLSYKLLVATATQSVPEAEFLGKILAEEVNFVQCKQSLAHKLLETEELEQNTLGMHEVKSTISVETDPVILSEYNVLQEAYLQLIEDTLVRSDKIWRDQCLKCTSNFTNNFVHTLEEVSKNNTDLVVSADIWNEALGTGFFSSFIPTSLDEVTEGKIAKLNESTIHTDAFRHPYHIVIPFHSLYAINKPHGSFKYVPIKLQFAKIHPDRLEFEYSYWFDIQVNPESVTRWTSET